MKGTLALMALFGALTDPALASQYHRGQHDGPVRHADNMPIGYPGEPALVDRTIRVSMSDRSDRSMEFDPSSIEIRQNETIRFVLANDGSESHEFIMASPGEIADHREEMQNIDTMIHETGYATQVDPGNSRTLIWTFANEGTFEFACLIPGHYEAGMHGRLTVI